MFAGLTACAAAKMSALAVLAARAARLAVALVKKLHDAVLVSDGWRGPDLRSTQAPVSPGLSWQSALK